jgi:hypothetical protein
MTRKQDGPDPDVTYICWDCCAVAMPGAAIALQSTLRLSGP